LPGGADRLIDRNGDIYQMVNDADCAIPVKPAKGAKQAAPVMT